MDSRPSAKPFYESHSLQVLTAIVTLSAVDHVPVAGFAVNLGIDRCMSKARALTKLIGNGVAAIVVARRTGALDQGRMQREVDNASGSESHAPEEELDQREAHRPVSGTRA